MILKWMKNLIRQIPFVGQYLYNLLSSLKWQSLLKSGVVFLFAGYLAFYINLKQQNCIYQYTHLPDELTRKGFTESFAVRQIQRIKSFMIAYRSDIRLNVDNRKDRSKDNSDRRLLVNRNYETFTSDQMQTIEHLKIGSISIEALIVLTDKLVSFFGIDSDNYMVLEYSLIAPNTIQLNATLGSNHSVFTETVHGDNFHDALSSLNIRAAKMILEKKDPTALIEYYYNLTDKRACAAVCRRVLMDITDKEVRADAFGYLSTVAEDPAEYLWYQTQASRLSSEWHELMVVDAARFGLETTKELDSLVQLHPENSMYHQARLDYYVINNNVGETADLNNCIASIKKSIPEYPSTVHYDYATLLAEWGTQDGEEKWLDSAIAELRRAINWEQRETKYHTPNAGLLANYYNNLAYAFEEKVLTRLDSCTKFYGMEDDGYLDSCHNYAVRAIFYNPQNQWAWSTHAEYYGLRYMNTGRTDDSVLFYNGLAKALRLGYDPDEWKSPPYCMIDSIQRSQMLSTAQSQIRLGSNEMMLMKLVPLRED